MLGVTAPAVMWPASTSRSLARSLDARPVSRWLTHGVRIMARSWRSMPPVRLPLLSAADDDGRAGGGECAPQPGERGVAGDVDDQVVVVHTIGEVLPGVVDDTISTEICYQV